MARIFAALSAFLIVLATLVALYVLSSQPSSSQVAVTSSISEKRQHGDATNTFDEKLSISSSGRVRRSSISSERFIEIRGVKSGFPAASANHTSDRTNVTNNQMAQIEIAWCVLDANNTYRFQHFAHASQSLFPCWSYFERMREMSPKLTCGFWFRGWTPRKSRYTWQSSLMAAMGCIQTSSPPEFPRQDFHRIELVGGFVAQVGNRTTVPDVRWFDRPKDAWALRETVLQLSNFTAIPRPRPIHKRSDQLRIGFVRRIKRKRRVIINQDEIASALQTAFRRAIVTNATLEWMQLEEQVHYFASQDIIIAAHGASLTNCAFLQPDTIVVQLYPRHYYPTFFFEPLIRQVRSHPFAWYGGSPEDPLQDHILHPNTVVHRMVDLHPPAAEIVAIVEKATRDLFFLKDNSQRLLKL